MRAAMKLYRAAYITGAVVVAALVLAGMGAIPIVVLEGPRWLHIAGMVLLVPLGWCGLLFVAEAVARWELGSKSGRLHRAHMKDMFQPPD